MYPGTYYIHQPSNAQGYPVFNTAAQRNVLLDGSPDRKLFDAVKYASEEDFVALMHAALAEGASLHTVDDQNKSLLDVAISRDSIRIVQALVAQGATLPSPDFSGFDLLMQAAVAGNVQIMDLLMDAYRLQPDATDHGGWTALHYAAMSGSSAAVEALLRRDVECNDSATGTDHNPLCQIFQEKYGLHEQSLTPLNIAVVSGHKDSVQVLLEHGAQVLPGNGNPIQKAIRGRDPAMLALLLEHCKSKGNLPGLLDQAMLEECLLEGDHTQMLRLVLDCHRTLPIAAFDLDKALLVSIALEHPHQLALILAEGGRLDPSELFYWSIACSAEERTIPELLTAYCDTAFEALMIKPQDGSPSRLLLELPELAKNKTALSRNGVFSTLLDDAVEALDGLDREILGLSQAQIAAETSHSLLRFLPRNTSDQENDRHEALVPAAELQQERALIQPAFAKKVQQVMTERRSRMLDLAKSQINALHDALTRCLSSEFFSAIRAGAGDGSIVPEMEYPLREVAGVPEALVSLIIDTWTEAADLMLKDSNNNAAPDATAVFRLMANTLFCKLDQIKVDVDRFLTSPESLLHDCTKKLRAELSVHRAQWRPLITHPANFLRQLEGRTSLRPVAAPSLTQAIANATGLPLNLCVSMVNCWQRAVEDARSVPDSGRATQRFQHLDQAFAGYWQDWLEENASDAETVLLPFTPQEVLQSIDWCTQKKQAARAEPSSEESRKRKAGGEPEGAPPSKPPRLQ